MFPLPPPLLWEWLLLLFAFLSSVDPLFNPRKALLFFLLLIPHALHRDCKREHGSENQDQSEAKWRFDPEQMGAGGSITLGPAGPPLQRGVLVVPQSAQVFFGSLTWLSADETASGFLLFMSSDSDPCTKKWNETEHETEDPRSKKGTHYKGGDDHSLSHSDPPSPTSSFQDPKQTQMQQLKEVFTIPLTNPENTQMETEIYPSFGKHSGRLTLK